MLEWQYGKIVFECGSCDTVRKTDTRDFDDARATMQREQWKAEKIGDLRIHACPNCEIDR